MDNQKNMGTATALLSTLKSDYNIEIIPDFNSSIAFSKGDEPQFIIIQPIAGGYEVKDLRLGEKKWARFNCTSLSEAVETVFVLNSIPLKVE